MIKDRGIWLGGGEAVCKNDIETYARLTSELPHQVLKKQNPDGMGSFKVGASYCVGGGARLMERHQRCARVHCS